MNETEYRNCQDCCDNLKIRNCSPDSDATDNSQPWWCRHGGATAATDMSKESKENRAWPKGLVFTGPGPNTSIMQMQITLSPPGGAESAKMNTFMNHEHHLPSTSHSHSQLAAYSMTGTTYQYHDACYGGLMPPLGIQSLNSDYSIMAQGRMALPLVMAEEPVYVNAKQYHGILRRRQSRAKAEVENKILRSPRKPYLHESRHLHAMRRERGCGGRFVSKKKNMETTSFHA